MVSMEREITLSSQETYALTEVVKHLAEKIEAGGELGKCVRLLDEALLRKEATTSKTAAMIITAISGDQGLAIEVERDAESLILYALQLTRGAKGYDRTDLAKIRANDTLVCLNTCRVSVRELIGKGLEPANTLKGFSAVPIL
jgi:hypothetical protein